MIFLIVTVKPGLSFLQLYNELYLKKYIYRCSELARAGNTRGLRLENHVTCNEYNTVDRFYKWLEVFPSEHATTDFTLNAYVKKQGPCFGVLDTSAA